MGTWAQGQAGGRRPKAEPGGVPGSGGQQQSRPVDADGSWGMTVSLRSSGSSSLAWEAGNALP